MEFSYRTLVVLYCLILVYEVHVLCSLPTVSKLPSLPIFQHLQLTNGRGHTLRCSHYVPSPFLEDTPLPCVVYCHGNRCVMAIGDNSLSRKLVLLKLYLQYKYSEEYSSVSEENGT